MGTGLLVGEAHCLHELERGGWAGGLRGRQSQEDLVACVAQRLEGHPAVDLQPRVHEVGALLQLVGAHEGPQVVLPPAVEALLPAQCLRGRSMEEGRDDYDGRKRRTVWEGGKTTY